MLTNFANSEHRCFGIFRGSILRIDLVIRLKRRNQFFRVKLGPKVPKFLKTHISRATRESCLAAQNDRKTWFTMGGYHRRTTGCIKLVDPSKWQQKWIYHGCSKICIPLKQQGEPQTAFFCFIFPALYDEIWKVSISREIELILNWLNFQNDL